MSRSTRSPRSLGHVRGRLGRLAAFWVAGLLGAFAAGLYLFGPPALEADTKKPLSAAAPLPAEIVVEGVKDR